MKSDHILSLIRTELAKSPRLIDPLRVLPTTNLAADLELDSLDLEELLLDIEPLVHTELTQAPKAIATIEDLTSHILKHLK